ncbi:MULTISPECIES: cupin domain-containing protein [Pandoraea]|uniref:cupin n=1 Tax=Pandoraea TaxID=93217 RepID=UPI0003D1C933|nr:MULTISPECIES: cupin [Pandoraea]AHB77158.1 cupin [Pandoraea pnomenusa]QDH59106.1 cupin [Pandoraea pnomenusa]
MAINKLHDEFRTIDMTQGWEVPPGYPPGIEQKILAGSLDEANGAGSRTRLLRFAPGIHTTAPFVHTYWEEVYLVSGDLTVGNDAQGEGGEAFAPNTYACRPPGAFHGPFKSNGGCLLLEIHYYDPA